MNDYHEEVVRILKASDKEVITLIDNGVKEVDNVLDVEMKPLFSDTMVKNIPEEFGNVLEHIIKVGFRFVSKRVLNNKLLNESTYTEALRKLAKQENFPSVIEYVKHLEHNYLTNINFEPPYGMYSMFSRKERCLYMQIGRSGIGTAHISKRKLRNDNFTKQQYFQYLTQQHVDIIPDAKIKTCVQDFLDYRNNFMAGFEALQNKTIPVDVTTTLIKTSTVNYKTVINHDNKPQMDNNYFIFEKEEPITINEMFVSLYTGQPLTWDKLTLEHNNYSTTTQTQINISFIHRKTKEFSPLQHLTVMLASDISKYIKYDLKAKSPASTYNGTYRTNVHNEGSHYNSREAYLTNGFTTKFAEVLQHPEVATVINNIMKFYTEQSKLFNELKEKYVSLIVLNQL